MILWMTRDWLGAHRFWSKRPEGRFIEMSSGEVKMAFSGNYAFEEHVYGFDRLFPLVGLSSEGLVRVEIVEERDGYFIHRLDSGKEKDNGVSNNPTSNGQ